jgi:hypothetical protein
MRLAILALLMCAGSVAICQSSPPVRVSPQIQGQPGISPQTGVTKLPPNWSVTPTMPVPSDPNISQLWNNPRREWKINPKQPLSGIGWGEMLVARNGQPNPQPPNAKVEPIPTQWPNAKVEPIPTQWPDFKLLPITIKSISPMMPKTPAGGDSK